MPDEIPRRVVKNVAICNWVPAGDCFEVPEQTAERVAYELIHKIILQYRTLKNLLSDQGTQFLSRVIQETCRLMKIKKLQTTAFHPQSNGICERFHRTLIHMMSYFVNKEA